MQTRSAARNKKDDRGHEKHLGRRGPKGGSQLKTTKKQATPSPPQEPSSPEISESESPESPPLSFQPAATSIPISKSNIINNNSNTKPIEASNTTPSPASSSRPLSRSMTLRSSLGARPKRRIWSPESSKKSVWQDESKFYRMQTTKKGRKPIQRYDSESSSLSSSDDKSEVSSEEDISRRGYRKRKSTPRKRLSRSSASSDDSDVMDYSDSSSDSSLSSSDDDDSSDSDSDDEIERRHKRKYSGKYKSYRKNKIEKENEEGVKSDTEGAEALLDLAAGSLMMMDEENRRHKAQKQSTKSYSRPAKKPKVQPAVRDERPKDPSFDIRNFLVPPPVFPKMASGGAQSGGPPSQQPVWKRGALHAAIAYYVFYQQRYDLLQQLSVPNAQYAQKFLLALSLDPTVEAKMLRERAEAAKLQLRNSKLPQEVQDKGSTVSPATSPSLSSAFSLYPNSSPSQTRSPKPVSPILSPLPTQSKPRQEPASSVVILSSPINPTNSPPASAFVSPNMTSKAPSASDPNPEPLVISSNSEDPMIESTLPLVTFSELTTTDAPHQDSEQVSFSASEIPTTPTTENTSLEESPSFDGLPGNNEATTISAQSEMQLDFNPPRLTEHDIDEQDKSIVQLKLETPSPSDDVAPEQALLVETNKNTANDITSEPQTEKSTPAQSSATPPKQDDVDLDSADWSTFPLGATFRKGRLGSYSPAQVMVSPFNYLMASPIDPSRSYKYGNSPYAEDLGRQTPYADYHRQYRNQNWQHLSKAYSQHPYSLYYPHLYHGSRTQSEEEHQRNQASAAHNPYEWHQQYLQNFAKNTPKQDTPPTRDANAQQPTTSNSLPQQSSSAPASVPSPYNVDQRSASTRSNLSPELHATVASTDSDSWAQQYSHMMYKQYQQHAQQSTTTDPPQSSSSLQHSTENLDNLKRQIRSKALAARGSSVFVRRNQQHNPIQQDQLDQQPTSQSTQPTHERYIIINDDEKVPSGGVPHNREKENQEKPPTIDLEKDDAPKLQMISVSIVDSTNAKPPAIQIQHQAMPQQQQQLQQHLQQQQQKQLQLQRDQAALLAYQKQMHQRSHFSMSEPVHRITIQPSRVGQPIQVEQPAQPTPSSNTQPPSDSSEVTIIQPNNRQRLQQLHFQFKNQRMQQMQQHQNAQNPTPSTSTTQHRALIAQQYAQYAQNPQHYVQQLSQKHLPPPPSTVQPAQPQPQPQTQIQTPSSSSASSPLSLSSSSPQTQSQQQPTAQSLLIQSQSPNQHQNSQQKQIQAHQNQTNVQQYQLSNQQAFSLQGAQLQLGPQQDKPRPPNYSNTPIQQEQTQYTMHSYQPQQIQQSQQSVQQNQAQKMPAPQPSQPTSPRQPTNMQQWQMQMQQFKIAPQGSLLLNSALQNTRKISSQNSQLSQSSTHKPASSTQPGQAAASAVVVQGQGQVSTQAQSQTQPSAATSNQSPPTAFNFVTPTSPFNPTRKQHQPQSRLLLEPVVRPPSPKTQKHAAFSNTSNVNIIPSTTPLNPNSTPNPTPSQNVNSAIIVIPTQPNSTNPLHKSI